MARRYVTVIKQPNGKWAVTSNVKGDSINKVFSKTQVAKAMNYAKEVAGDKPVGFIRDEASFRSFINDVERIEKQQSSSSGASRGVGSTSTSET